LVDFGARVVNIGFNPELGLTRTQTVMEHTAP